MLSALILLAASFQVPGPSLAPASSASFQSLVLSIEDSLQAQDFEKAKAQFRLLPKENLTFSWDDSKVPASYRPEFIKARDEALAMWRKWLPGLDVKPKSGGDIHFSFEPVLANRPGSTLPAGHVGFFNEAPDQPRLDYVIGLQRGRPNQPSQVMDILSDVAYAIGSYWGIADGVYDTYVMAASDLPRVIKPVVSGTEVTTLRRNMTVVQFLSQAIKDRKVVIPTRAEMHIAKTTIVAPKALQGDRVQMSIEVSNSGNGPLDFSMSPDCGCTIVTEPGSVDPQSTRVLDIAVNTDLFTRDMEKHIVLYTNDPVNPVSRITLKIPISPRFRLIAPEGDTAVVPKGGKKLALYLIPTKAGDIEPISFKYDGLPASVKQYPFSGLLADSEANEAPKMRTGFKYVFDIKDTLPPGRASGTLQIFTSSSLYPTITWTLNAQRGIIALPEELALGSLGRVPRTEHVLISAPGMPFKILSAEANTPDLKVTYAVVPGTTDYKLTVQYNGKAKSGEMLAEIKIKTTSSTQPILHVPVHALVL